MSFRKAGKLPSQFTLLTRGLERRKESKRLCLWLDGTPELCEGIKEPKPVVFGAG